jgi:putative polyketide hydroxylase
VGEIGEAVVAQARREQAPTPGPDGPAGREPVIDRPAGREPGTDRPVGWGPGTDRPVGWGPGTDRPVGWGPGTDRPVGWGRGAGGRAGWGRGVDVPVVVVGGGLVGLSASLFLSWHGVESVLFERHEGTSPQPKARRINLRTMELFRQVGVEEAVIEAAAALADFQSMAAGPTLAQAQLLPFGLPGGVPNWGEISPSLSCLCAQDALEPVLRRLAVDRGGEVRFGTEVLDTAADDEGVTVTVRSGDGRVRELRAGYVIAADGARSPVRERLGIGRSGRGTLGRFVNVYIRADLTDLVRGREFNLCQIENPLVPGGFASINGTDRWIFSTLVAPGRTQAEWEAVVRTAIGAPAEVEVLSVLEWEPGMFVADRFQHGRIMLAGDAAHVMPPYAALGANTGVQDVHNLAWKLALMLDGTAGPRLLDSYHQERHPAAWFAADQSSIRSGNLREMTSASTDGTPLAHPLALVFGGQYAEGAVVGDGSAAALDRLDLAGQPGTRLPHAWLEPHSSSGSDGRRSTLDLAGRGLTLLTVAEGDWWERAAAGVAGVRVVRVGSDAGARAWARAAGIGDKGAVLVRPDHVVAWRCAGSPDSTQANLGQVTMGLLS